MMIPNIVRYLLDIDYLLSPSLSTTTCVIKPADLAATINDTIGRTTTTTTDDNDDGDANRFDTGGYTNISSTFMMIVTPSSNLTLSTKECRSLDIENQKSNRVSAIDEISCSLPVSNQDLTDHISPMEVRNFRKQTRLPFVALQHTRFQRIKSPDVVKPSNSKARGLRPYLRLGKRRQRSSVAYLPKTPTNKPTEPKPVTTNVCDIAAATFSERVSATESFVMPSIVDCDSVSIARSYTWNGFFIRIQDLDVEYLPRDVSFPLSVSSLSTISTSYHKLSSRLSYDDKCYFHTTSQTHLSMILDGLVQYGYRTISQPNQMTDGVDHIDFQPTRDTQRFLQHQQKNDLSFDDELNESHIYTWIGTKREVDVSDTFGNTWPITKVRAIIPNTTPLQLITFLFDSSQVPKYNNISLGREDLMTLSSKSSNDCLIGTVKIVRGRVQPKLFPKVIETLSVMYITIIPGEVDGYMIVSRSIMEDETWGDDCAVLAPSNSKNSAPAPIRSEMLLNVYFVRPIYKQDPDDVDRLNCCELITVTHVVSSGVPEIFAKRMAPMTATTMVREIQNIFAAKVAT